MEKHIHSGSQVHLTSAHHWLRPRGGPGLGALPAVSQTRQICVLEPPPKMSCTLTLNCAPIVSNDLSLCWTPWAVFWTFVACCPPLRSTRCHSCLGQGFPQISSTTNIFNPIWSLVSKFDHIVLGTNSRQNIARIANAALHKCLGRSSFRSVLSIVFFSTNVLLEKLRWSDM